MLFTTFSVVISQSFPKPYFISQSAQLYIHEYGILDGLTWKSLDFSYNRSAENNERRFTYVRTHPKVCNLDFLISYVLKKFVPRRYIASHPSEKCSSVYLMTNFPIWEMGVELKLTIARRRCSNTGSHRKELAVMLCVNEITSQVCGYDGEYNET
ncbi:hypothetical protein BDQ17DRAFT_1354164 [Cyathus striatus]|nr:hypothetical protein BDQ17DRAFT_1354164 [Cyathus striatus]